MMNPITVTPEEYQSTKPYPHIFMDNFLKEDIAHQVQQEILDLDLSNFDRYDNPFEQKYTLRDKDKYPTSLKSLMVRLTSTEFVQELSHIVGYNLINDPDRNFWGVHVYKPGDKLDIHVDAGKHPRQDLKKQVTLGIYLSSNWKESYGCHLEVWDGDNSKSDNAKIHKCITKIAPMFNRLVVFTCDDNSWHGNPIPCDSPDDARRIFVTLSYLSNNQDYENHRQKAFFVPRPQDTPNPEKDRLRFLRADPIKYKEVYRYNDQDKDLNKM